MYCQMINSHSGLCNDWNNGPPSNPNSIAITNATNGLGTTNVIIPHLNSPQAINNGSSPRQNYKTELCKNYTESGGCPYGWRCKFAHGKDELARFANAYQMHANGLIENPHTYLSLPCFNHVATGSCPMGTRCSSLHDPRVEGSSPSWLKLWNKPKSCPGVIPDGLHHHREQSCHQVNPIIDFKKWNDFGNETYAFKASYNLVCNVGVPVFDQRFSVPKCPSKITDAHRLAITRVMLKKKAANSNFVYSNKKLLHGQPCSILQTSYFHLTDLTVARRIEDIVKEVNADQYYSGSSQIVRADEIVFESKGKPGCNDSIWFDAKFSSHGGRSGFGMNTRPKGEKGRQAGKEALFVMPENETFQRKLRELPTVIPFILMQPKDDCIEGYNLIDAILKHRIGSILTASSIKFGSWKDNVAELEADFDRLKLSSKKWTWPVHADKDKIFQSGQIYEEYTSNKYVPQSSDDSKYSLCSMWSKTCTNLGSTFDSTLENKPRLDVFVSISTKTKADCKGIPRITNSPTKKSISPESEDTWKELLWGVDGPWKQALHAYNSGRDGRSRSSSSSSSL